jgi:hypothetical protein
VTSPTSSATAPGEGERRAQRGYTRQYSASAAVIYAWLERGELEWVGLADRTAGAADDVVIGLPGRVVGHQFKNSQFPSSFRLKTLLMGSDGLLKPLVSAWQALRLEHVGKEIEIRLVTNDFPSTTDNLNGAARTHSAAFLKEFELNPRRALASWYASSWKPMVKELAVASGLEEPAFELFLQSLRILTGSSASFDQSPRHPPSAAKLIDDIAAILPRLVADARDKDRWTRSELLQELGWRDTAISRHVHRFPVGAYVQRNIATETKLREVISRTSRGYVSLVGPPGAGKSTLLQSSLEAERDLRLVRYLAFVPGVGQGVGRGEAEDFFDDLNSQLKSTGLIGLRYRDVSLSEKRDQFSALLKEAGARFSSAGIKTLIVVDGLDHIPREEKPQRSLLSELPLPNSLPDGVLFVLGTQRVSLDDIMPAVCEEASDEERSIKVAPLARDAVHRMADLLDLEESIDRDAIFDLAHGHPLVTRYVIEALRDSDTEARDKLLNGAFSFDGDIESVYEAAWRSFREDDQARLVLDYLARAEGAVPLELLTDFIPEQAIERAFFATRHLLIESKFGWNVFHNSFRLFILDKPRLRLGKPDRDFGKQVYRNLAKMATKAPHSSPQHWLELRYLARAEDHEAVLRLAAPKTFRRHFAERRPYSEMRADLRLAFGAARHSHQPAKVFELLLILDEVGRRWSSYEYASGIVDLLLAIGDLDGAIAFVDEVPDQGYEVVDELLLTSDFERARRLFENLEPLKQLLSSASPSDQLEVPEMEEWVRRAVHFREPDQIFAAIKKLSGAARLPGLEPSQDDSKDLENQLLYAAASTICMQQDGVDVEELGQKFNIDPSANALLLLDASIGAASRGSTEIAIPALTQAVSNENFLRAQNAKRRTAALFAARAGHFPLAKTIFAGLRVPTLAALDDVTDEDAPDHLARAVMEHAELSAILGLPTARAVPSKREALRPLQQHAEAVGRVLGAAELDPARVPQGEVARVAKAALTYLERVQPSSDEFYALRQIGLATPVLGRALIRAATLCGPTEFASTIAQFDQAFAEPEGRNSGRSNLRREISIEVFRCTGNTEEASHRLDAVVDGILEDTPEQQIGELAAMGTTFAKVGNFEAAGSLLSRLPEESLGYALPAKKDSQYSTWRDLLRLANRSDPLGRAGRVALLMRQATGMMETEGRGAAYRIAPTLLTEAALCDAQTAWGAAKLLSGLSAVGWAIMINALFQGLVVRKPELCATVATAWCELALPYYFEPYYSESNLGSFLDAVISSAPSEQLPILVQDLVAAIESESRTHERAGLLDRLRDFATKRGSWEQQMEAARIRWGQESPPPRSSNTPSRYDDVASLHALKVQLEKDANEEAPGFYAAHAFCRLAPTSDFQIAYDLFNRWQGIGGDSHARFIVIELAIAAGNIDVARELMRGYELAGDERATWARWTGGSSLRYFKAKLRLDGDGVYKEAYEHFLRSLAAGGESIQSVLPEHEEIFRTLSSDPDWVSMWNSLAEQLATTREHALGNDFSVDSSIVGSDDALIAEFIVWAFRLPIDELRLHASRAALRILALPSGKQIFKEIAGRLLRGEDNEIASALELLLRDETDALSAELRGLATALIDHPDFVVAELAATLAKRWGASPAKKTEELPSFYSLILDGATSNDDTLSTPAIVENPISWVKKFSKLVGWLAVNDISENQIVRRAGMFIEKWGGAEPFGKSATSQLEADLRRLDMKMMYARPNLAVAVRALRHVAGELRKADAIPATIAPDLLYLMGFPFPALSLLQPAHRPPFIARPRLNMDNWQDRDEEWLNGVSRDVAPLSSGNDTMLAELTEFHIGRSRRFYSMYRVRAPGLALGEGDQQFTGHGLLPRAFRMGKLEIHPDGPARTVVRELTGSFLPEVPSVRLTFCPVWLQVLEWHLHPESELIVLNRSNEVVARIVWWRDGGPVDIEEDVIWGQGHFVSLTPAGRQQIESQAGALDVRVFARRSFTGEGRNGNPKSRVLGSRD